MRCTTVASVALAALLVVLQAGVADAVPRGKPNTSTRDKYCQEKYDKCVDDANAYCDRKGGGKTKAAMICFTGAQNACEGSWGKSSTCRTEARVQTMPDVASPDALNGGVLEQQPTPPATGTFNPGTFERGKLQFTPAN